MSRGAFYLLFVFISLVLIQVLVLNKNPYQETSQMFIIMIYFIDSILLLYSCVHGILKFMSIDNEDNRMIKSIDLVTHMISCLGVCHFD